ncbi:GntR family transcriptional regulator [Klebsiella pneumoniae]
MLNFRYIGPVPLLFKGPIQVNNWTTGVCVIEIHLSRSATALPLYHQIEQQISWQIIKGRLNYGEYLPPSRELARQLRVSRGSVVRAYEALCVKEYCHSHTGRGTMVIYREKPDASPPGPVAAAPPRSPTRAINFFPGAYPCFPAMPARPIFRSVSSGRLSTACCVILTGLISLARAPGIWSYVN